MERHEAQNIAPFQTNNFLNKIYPYKKNANNKID